jgi:Resolvase, N terminal domain
MIIGYARVSTDGQSLDSQQASLKAAGAEWIFSEKISGAITDRKALAKALAGLQTGDVLLVTRLDRLARSNPRPAEHPRYDQQSWSQVQIPCRRMGRYDNAARRAYDYDPGRSGNLRETSD